MSAAAVWEPLRDSGLHAGVVRVRRADVAFFKHLFESYEEVGIVRTVETRSDGSVLIAILVPADHVRVAAAILEDVARVGAPPFDPEALPPVCTEDWFLETWTRETESETDRGAATAHSPAGPPSEPPASPVRKT